jgi:hypothetical protein
MRRIVVAILLIQSARLQTVSKTSDNKADNTSDDKTDIKADSIEDEATATCTKGESGDCQTFEPRPMNLTERLKAKYPHLEKA